MHPERAGRTPWAKFILGAAALCLGALFLVSAAQLDSAQASIDTAGAVELGDSFAVYGIFNDALRYFGYAMLAGGLLGIGAGMAEIYLRRNKY